MKHFFLKYREGVAILLYVSAVAYGIVFVTVPEVRRAYSIIDDTERFKVEEQLRSEQLNGVAKVKGEFDEMDSRIKGIGGFVTREDMVSLIRQIEKLGEDTDNKVTIKIKEDALQGKKKAQAKKNASDEKEKTITESLPTDRYIGITIELTGTFRGAYAFMRRMESLPQYGDIIAFSIEQSKQDGAGNVQQQSDPFISEKLSGSNEDGVRVEENTLKSVIDAVFYLEPVKSAL